MSHLSVVPPIEPTAPRASRGSGPTSVRVEAPAALALHLSLGSAHGGARSVATALQAVRLIETATARRQSAEARGSITVSVESGEPLPDPADSLAARAAALLADEAGVDEGVDLLLRRRVPADSGLAGASADAAAVLLACNQLWGAGLSASALAAVGARVGAVVPFALLGGAAVGHGDGEPLSPLMGRRTFHWVLAPAAEPLPTGEVLGRFDGTPGPAEPAEPPEELTAALRTGDAIALAPALHNDLEPVIRELRPSVGEAIAIAEDAGALRAIPAGPGATVAALVPDAPTAARVARALAASGLVADAVRADAPVAGARAVG